MLERIKLYLGLGPAEAYGSTSKGGRFTLLAVQFLWVIAFLTVDTWPVRAVVGVAGIVMTLAVSWVIRSGPSA